MKRATPPGGLWRTLLAGVVLALSAGGGRAALPAAVDGTPLPSLAPMLERVTPAVVNIATRGKVVLRESPFARDPFFRYFFDVPTRPRERMTQSLGSGVIVDAAKGYVLTNAHVLENAHEIRDRILEHLKQRGGGAGLGDLDDERGPRGTRTPQAWVAALRGVHAAAARLKEVAGAS